MSKARWSPKDFKDNGLIEVNGVYVKASSQVAKKVDKIVSGIPMFNEAPKVDIIPRPIDKSGPVFDIKALNNQIAQLEFKVKNGTMFVLPSGEPVDVKYRFVIDPISTPRMSQSDKWKTDPNHPDPKKRQRKPVENYFRFKNRLVSMCEVSGYKLTKTLNIIFVVPFPKSYSAKKMARLDGNPHDQKPDIDNFSKCWMDSLSDNDREVWNLHAIKLWGHQGQIIIF